MRSVISWRPRATTCARRSRTSGPPPRRSRTASAIPRCIWHRCRSQVERMTLLVDDLLDLSRFDAGAMPLDVAETELEPLLDDCLALYAADARTAQVSLERECPPGLRGRCDPLQLGRVLSNLVANAIRHTPPGGRVVISARDGVEVSVSDTGAGFRPAPGSGCSSASGEATRAAGPAAPASASRSRARSSSSTAERSASPTRPAAAPASRSRCRLDGPGRARDRRGSDPRRRPRRQCAAATDRRGHEAPDVAPVAERAAAHARGEGRAERRAGMVDDGLEPRPVTSATICFQSARRGAAVGDAGTSGAGRARPAPRGGGGRRRRSPPAAPEKRGRGGARAAGRRTCRAPADR